jgi:hypothetical protein
MYQLMPSRVLVAKLIPIFVMVVTPLIGTVVFLQDLNEEPIFEILLLPEPFLFYLIDIPCIVISLAYGLYPALYNHNKLFKKNRSHTTEGYRFLVKILFVEIPLLVVFTLLYYLFYYSDVEPFYTIDPTGLTLYAINLPYFLVYSVLGGLIWIASNKINKDFYFYLAKGSIESILEKNEIAKVQFMLEGLKFYNRYLRRVIKLQIHNIEQIFSKLLSDSKIDKFGTMQSIYEAFEGDDKLLPISRISTVLNIQETEKLLVRESALHKIKSWGTYVIASVIPTVVSLIQMFYPQKVM